MKKAHMILLLLLLGTLGGSVAAVGNAQPDRPNVLLIMADDLNTALSGYGHPECKTPNLDRLAARGVQFERMYCQFPLCGPSRNSILTGLYPYKTNTLLNPVQLRDKAPDVVTLPQLFRANDYYVARVSKIFHMGIPAEIQKGTAEYDDPDSWDHTVNVLCKDNPGPTENWSPDKKGSQGFVATYGTEGDSSYADGMAADRAIELLKKMDPDKPFFLGVGFVRPHVPLISPQKYYDLYNRSELTPPFAPENDLDDLPKVVRNDQTAEAYGVTTLELHQGLLEAYYASISYVDAQVGKLLDALDDNNLAGNTVIVFLSDHGYHVGDHHKFQKRLLFEETTRVPFIVSVPWLSEQHGHKSAQITELIDLFPTLTDIAGIAAPEEIQGSSLLPLLQDADSSAWPKTQALTVAEKGGESLRTADWRFTQWGFGEDGYELYDLKKDPGEFNNEANNPEYAATLIRLKKQLEDRRLQAGYQGDVTKEHANKEKVLKANRAKRKSSKKDR